MLLPLLIVSASYAADCPATLDDLHQPLERGLEAFENMDADGFEAARLQFEELVQCPDGAVDAMLVRRAHFVMALDAYMAQDSERTKAAFKAVLAVDPTFSLSWDLAPRGNLLRELWDQARKEESGDGAELATPTTGSFWVDGLPSTTRPSDRPFVLQWIDEHGNVRWSQYLPAGAHLPIEVLAAMHEEDPMEVFTAAPPPPSKPGPVIPAPDDDASGQAGSVILLASAGGVALASGGLYLASALSKNRWQEAVDECVVWGGCADDPQAALQEHEDMALRARKLGYAAQGGAGLALGLGLVGGFTLLW